MNFKFVRNLLIISAILVVITFLLFTFIGNEEQYWFLGTIAFFTLLGLFIGRITQKSVTATNAAFFRGVMGAIGLRMLFSLIFLAAYMIISDLKSTPFIVYFLILYLLYTIFEIYQLVSKLRPEKKDELESTNS
ncbi:MAG: hypothetical protein RLZZ337_931 [Bacteroidota bacterium]|jgi:hypothetical protein